MSKSTKSAESITNELQDDAVIGQFFRRSLMVFALLGAIGLAVLFWPEPQITTETINEAVLDGPKISDQVGEPDPPSVSFTDVTASAGIDFVHVNGAYGEKLLPETMGGGVAVFDYDNDGRNDLLLINSSDWPWHPQQMAANKRGHKLYRNLGNWQFDDVTQAVGLDAEVYYGMGVAVGDYDADGFQDLFITAVGDNYLYRNVEGKRFEKMDIGVSGGTDEWSTSAAFFDMDNDQDLDLFVCNYVKWSREIDLEVDYQLTGVGRAYGPPTNYAGSNSRLFRNDNGQFTDVSQSAGITVANPATGHPVGKALAVQPIDLNGDGALDLLVANDTVQNFAFINDGKGQFTETGAVMGVAFDNGGSATGAMGIDTAYFNNTDDLGVVIANFANEMTSFYVARAGDVFTDESIITGIGPDSRRALSFGVFFFDYDLDGRLDLLSANGHVEDDINTVQPSQHYEQAGQLFWNCGDQCRRTFKRVPDDRIGSLVAPVVGRGATYADLDGDGDLDVVLTQVGRRPVLLRNDQQQAHNWLRLALKQPGNNRHAIGARITIVSAKTRQQQVIMPTKSYLSQVPHSLTFGLGDAQLIEVQVEWPDGKSSKYNGLAINQAHLLER